ncbi:MAG: hypothetical protein H0U74_23565 [Bradymonadaceae bacterium]|nr:hypothetical protein [Lujinxingiaceae bacterium]
MTDDNRSKSPRRWFAFALTLTLVAISGGHAGCERAGVAPEQARAEAPSPAKRTGLYTARLNARSLDVGAEPVKVTLTVEPGPGLKINLEYPWHVALQESDGISFATASFGKGDIELSEERAVVPVVVSAHKAGDLSMVVIANMSVCNDDRCEILRDEQLLLKIEAVEEINQP